MGEAQSEDALPLIVQDEPRPKPKLPVKQLAVLAICRLSEPICLTSIFSYLPEMIRSFGVPETDVGFWAGITAASFSLAQCTSGIAWGRLSDRIGRKPTILFGFLGMFTSVIIFGFSTSIAMAMVSRCLTGLLNGNVGILRTIVAELVPQKELQPRAFSILPLVWSIGSIMGPIIGGFLSEPAQKYPVIFPKGSFFDKYPFALPNFFAGSVLFSAFLFGFLFVEETLVTKRGRYDPGREIGKKIEALFSCFGSSESETVKRDQPRITITDEEAPLISKHATYDSIKSTNRNESQAIVHPQPTKSAHAPLPWSQVLTHQSIYNISLYFLIAVHVVSYDSILPVFFSTHTPRESNPIRLPFHIPGGFGLNTSQIGLIYSANGIVAMILQFALYPPIARKWGSVKLLALSASIYPIIYFATPYLLAIEDEKTMFISWGILIFFKSLTGICAFTSSTILITNTASSVRVLGTLNGFAVSVAAMGRAIGPSIFGLLFSVGQKTEWTTQPWVGLTIVALLMWVWIPKLVEGGGLKNEEEESSSGSEDCSSIEEDRDRLVTEAAFNDSDDEEMDDEEVARRRRGHKHGTRRLSMGSVNEQ